MIENIYELKCEELDEKIREKISENQENLKLIEKEKLTEKIKESSIRMELEKMLKNIEENNSIKTSIIMKEMYKQGFIDGSNLLLDVKDK